MDESEKVKVTYNLKRRKYLISSMQAFTSKNKYNAYRISVSRHQFVHITYSSSIIGGLRCWTTKYLALFIKLACEPTQTNP